MKHLNFTISLTASLLGLLLLGGCQPKASDTSSGPSEAHTQVSTPSSPASAGSEASATPVPETQAVATPTPSAEPASATPATALQAPTPSAIKEGELTLAPLPGKEAPSLTEVVRVQVSTTSGDFVIAVYPQAAPHAAERFITLVQSKFYDNTPVSRVVTEPKPFVAQFGINSRMQEWQGKNFDDDPSLYSLEKGTLAFAKAGPNTNSTQVFINLTNNNFLTDPSMNFSAFARVESGLESIDKFTPTGDPGLDQGRLWSDPAYLDSVTNKPTMITSMKII